MGKHSESGQFNMQLSSEPSSAESQMNKQSERGASAPIHEEARLRNANTVASNSFLSGYSVHISRRQEGRCADSHKKGNNCVLANNAKQEKLSHKVLNVECNNDDSYLGDVDDHNNCEDKDYSYQEDGDGNDGGDGVSDNDCDTDGDHDDDDDGDGEGDDDDENDDCNDDNGNNDSYDDDDDDGDDDDNDTDHGDAEDDGDDEKDHENNDTEGYYGKEAHYSSKTEMSHASNHNAKTQTQSHGLPDSSSRDDVMSKTESTTSRSNKTDDEKLKVEGGRTAYTSNLKPEALPSGSNAIHLSQGAKPKTSSQRVLLRSGVDPGFLSNGRIPSLEITGIRQDFLARHTTDVSLPYESYPCECDFPIESTQWANRRHALSSNDHSSISRSLPLPPDREMRMSRHQGPGYSDAQRAYCSYQPTSPTMRLRSDWQLPYEPQTEKNSQFTRREEQWWSNPPDPWIANQQQFLAHGRHSGNFSSVTWPRVGNSLNRDAWILGSNESSWRYPSIDLYSSQLSITASATNQPALTLPAVRSRSPAVMVPSVTRADTQLQPSSNYISQSVAPNRFSSSAFSGFRGNGQERSSNSTMLRQNIRDNQENGRVNSSDMVPSRREEVRSGESGSLALPALGTLQQGSFTPNATEDCTLAALERKVAEACAVVERVMKEREERTIAQREAAQRERERRERMEREERERREREEGEIRQREAREREEREKRERDARERESREVRERDVPEQRENEEQGGREGERRVAGERTPVQESRRWQCQHYQRHCSVSFPCCGIFYPCHRCHNGSGACDADDTKANQATHVKCGNCGHEEEINERSQHCSSCGTKFSEYFCFKCKHFTGVEKNPFHCNKCGICRIYKDKSFHCDVCNVCLDKRLEGKHKCRPDSGHDECCICLEDAFSGCQILPCSHKVHKECAIAMIQNGVRNCPICRHPLFNQSSR